MLSLIRSWFVVRGSWFVRSLLQFTIHDSRFTAILFAGLLTACGFTPMYGEKTGDKALAGVMIEPIGGRMGQQFKANLEDRLNPNGAMPANPVYKLQVDLKSSAAAIGVARDGTISRYNVVLDSNYSLYRIADNVKIKEGNLRQISSYNNVTNAYFSTFISEQDALERGTTELAELYRQRLASYLVAQ